jgi:hypothetical protein
MRIAYFSILLAIALPASSHGDDLIPGVVTFDPPSFLYGGTSGRGSDDIFSGVATPQLRIMVFASALESATVFAFRQLDGC